MHVHVCACFVRARVYLLDEPGPAGGELQPRECSVRTRGKDQQAVSSLQDRQSRLAV